MGPALARLLVAAAALVIILAGGRAAASEITLIKYDLGGTVSYANGFIVNPVFSPSAPGPEGVGSMVTFRFAPLPSGGTSVQILTFVQSDLISLPLSSFTGHNLRVLRAPGITGGLLSGLTAVGTASGLANDYGTEHCFATFSVCQGLFFTSPSIPHPRTQTSGRSIWFAGNTGVVGAPGPGWVFNSDFTTVQASRPFFRFLGTANVLTTTHLVGTEVGRTVIPVPEPAGRSLLAAAFAAALSLLALRAMASAFRKRPCWLVAVVCVGALLCSGAALAQGSRNIVLIIADDVGPGNLAAADTPTLDVLASEGMTFSNAWANPSCATTRATIQTGRYSWRTGIRQNTGQLPAGEETIAAVLNTAFNAGGGFPDYEVAIFGKWGLADLGNPCHPHSRGLRSV